MSGYPGFDWRCDEDQSDVAAMVADGEKCRPGEDAAVEREKIVNPYAPLTDEHFTVILGDYLSGRASSGIYTPTSRLTIGDRQFMMFEKFDSCDVICIEQGGDIFDGPLADVDAWMYGESP